MSIIQGTFIYNGKPQNGATAKLWKEAGFASPPVLDDAEPNVSYQQGATITTGVSYGGDGAFRWTSVPAGRYYASCYYDNHRAWFFMGESDITAILTTQGDLLIRGASVPERLAKIPTGQLLRATATGYEGGSGIAVVSSGSYTGNATVNRAIPHGLGVTPKLIYLVEESVVAFYHIIGALAEIRSSTSGRLAVTIPDATNFYVGNATSYPQSANENLKVYDWVAIG